MTSLASWLSGKWDGKGMGGINVEVFYRRFGVLKIWLVPLVLINKKRCNRKVFYPE